MSDYLKAGESIARLASLYEDMVFASKALTDIGILENHLKELRAVRDESLKQNKAWSDERAAGRVQHAVDMQDLENEKIGWKLKWAEEILKERLTAAAFTKQSKDAADKLVEDAKKTAHDVIGEKEDALLALDEELKEVRKLTESGNATLDNLNNQIAVAQDARQKLMNYLDEIRSKPVA